MNTFGERLRELRNEIGKSQKEIGKIFNLSESTIGMYERNERKPDYETLQKFAEFFSKSTDYLLYGKEQTKSHLDRIDKDEIDVAKRMEQIKRDLASEDGLLFNGEPMSEEARESFLEAMEYAVRQTQRINKKYIPKKYRENE
jgi:transcriptional regulator with XRE-family HTH domain